MKCLYISDLHYVLQQFDWIAEIADDFDVIILGGDNLDISAAIEARVQIVVILKYLRRLQEKTQVIVSSGNHDLDARDDHGEKFAKWIAKVRHFGVCTDGDSLEIDGTLFTICPWWDGPESRDRVGEQLARDAALPKDRWIWVYHSPPAESPTSWGGKRDFGDADLVSWIEKYAPDIVLTGHIHQSPFVSGGSWVDQLGGTWIFNPGRQIGPTPAHIIFDLDARSAVWFSLAGEEIVELDTLLERPVAALTELPAWLK